MRPDGRVAAVVGTVVGAIVLAGVGAMALLIPCDPDGLECLGPVVIAVFTSAGGFVLGCLLGCYAALRIRHHVRAGPTVGVLVVLGALAGGASMGLALLGVPAGAFLPIAGACWFGLPILARDLALRVRSKSDGSSDILGAPPAEETSWTSSTAPKRKRSRRRSGSS